MIKIGLVGCKGKLGQEVIKHIAASTEFELCRAITSKGSQFVGECIDLLGANHKEVLIEDDLMACSDCELLIDTTCRKAFIEENYEKYKVLKKPIIIATTGFSKKDMEKINELALEMPIIQEANFSIELYYFIQAIKKYVKEHRALDVSIVEVHHVNKKDKPSGTALILRNEICEVNSELNVEILSIRAGAIYGEHSVRFANENGEEIIFFHKASSRKAFAAGILYVVPFMINKQNGFYQLKDIIS